MNFSISSTWDCLNRFPVIIDFAKVRLLVASGERVLVDAGVGLGDRSSSSFSSELEPTVKERLRNSWICARRASIGPVVCPCSVFYSTVNLCVVEPGRA